MIERALMTPDELKSLPRGTFIVMKTGFYPMQVHLKLFHEWGIMFPKDVYTVPDKGSRAVSYARKELLEAEIIKLYATTGENSGDDNSFTGESRFFHSTSQEVIRRRTQKKDKKTHPGGGRVSPQEKPTDTPPTWICTCS